jgi:hypothetical protein
MSSTFFGDCGQMGASELFLNTIRGISSLDMKYGDDYFRTPFLMLFGIVEKLLKGALSSGRVGSSCSAGGEG